MRSFSKQFICANVGRDPETQFTPSGKQVTKFSVAVSRYAGTSDGTAKRETDWFNITCWNKLAEIADNAVKQDMFAVLMDAPRTYFYEKEGVTKYGYEITADSLVVMPKSVQETET